MINNALKTFKKLIKKLLSISVTKQSLGLLTMLKKSFDIQKFFETFQTLQQVL